MIFQYVIYAAGLVIVRLKLIIHQMTLWLLILLNDDWYIFLRLDQQKWSLPWYIVAVVALYKGC